MCHFARWLPVFALLLPLAARAESRADEVGALIAQLGDPNPTVRQLGIEKLKALGLAARPGLLKAAQARDPAIRAAAGSLLLQLPFDVPGDPQAVRTLLSHYGRKDLPGRLSVIGQLAELRSDGSRRALERLLDEEPNQQAHWAIAAAIRAISSPRDLARLRQLDPRTDAATCVLVGWAWLNPDRAKAMEYFRRAVELEARQPSLDNGLMNQTFGLLRYEAMRRKQYNEAAQLLRQQLVRRPADSSEEAEATAAPPELFALFVLHMRFGPLEGFQDDVSLFRPYLDSAPFLCALGKRMEAGNAPLAAYILYRHAHLFTSPTADQLYLAGALLMRQDWPELARAPLEAVLKCQGDAVASWRVRAGFALKQIADQRGDNEAALGHLRQAIKDMQDAGLALSYADPTTGQMTVLELPTLQAEVHWRSARSAQARGDAAGVKEHVDALLRYQPASMEVALEAVPLLKELGREKEARQLFETVYAPLKTQLEAEPDSAELMNNMAWLLARCGERLEEAVQLANAAVDAAPDNAAYLDTAAEAHFQLGHKAEAIHLETQALDLRPDDAFMRRQLARFSK